MRIPTVVLENVDGKGVAPGTRRVVDAVEYGSDLGTRKWGGWKVVTEKRGSTKLKDTVDASEQGIPGKISQEEADKLPKPKRGRPRKVEEPEPTDVLVFNAPEEKL